MARRPQVGALEASPTDGSKLFVPSQRLSVLLLSLVTVIWGAQHSIIKGVLDGDDEIEAASLNLVRFGLAALCFFPWLPPSRTSRGRLPPEWRAGAELGFYMFLGFCLQAIGLLFTTAQRSGLLLYLNVKLVPFFAACLFGRNVQLSAWLSAAVAFLGTLLVAGDGASGVAPNIGDVLSLMAAAASALFILRLEAHAPHTDSKALNAVSTLYVALLCAVWGMWVVAFTPGSGKFSPAVRLRSSVADLFQNHLIAVLFLGVITTAFTNWLQTLGQRSVPATTASVIYALDPLWGCVFAYFWLGETLGLQGVLGCLLLLCAWGYQVASVRSAQVLRTSLGMEQPLL